jgi:hypothetical protein
VDVDPGQVLRHLHMAAQHFTQHTVAPGRAAATEEHAIRKVVLPLRHRGLEPRHAMLLHVGADGRLVRSIWRPLRRQQQGVQFRIGRIGWQGCREILEIAVQVDVFLRDTAQVRKTVRVERVDIEHRHTETGCPLAPFVILQGSHLHAAAAEPLDAVAPAGHYQQVAGIRRPGQGHIHGQGFAVAPR